MKGMPNILIVEDDPIAQLAVTYLLQDFNCQCYIVSSGRKAVNLAQERTYDLIFMDIGLFGVNGIDVAKEIRAKGIDIPIIALTAHGAESTKRKCLKAGMNDFINKPLNEEKAKELFNKYLNV